MEASAIVRTAQFRNNLRRAPGVASNGPRPLRVCPMYAEEGSMLRPPTLVFQPQPGTCASLQKRTSSHEHPPWGSNPRPQGSGPCALPTELGGLLLKLSPGGAGCSSTGSGAKSAQQQTRLDAAKARQTRKLSNARGGESGRGVGRPRTSEAMDEDGDVRDPHRRRSRGLIAQLVRAYG